jgi:hypothetical protein
MEGALTPEALSKMTRGTSVMDGGTFAANGVRETRETFLCKNFIGGRGRTAAH